MRSQLAYLVPAIVETATLRDEAQNLENFNFRAVEARALAYLGLAVFSPPTAQVPGPTEIRTYSLPPGNALRENPTFVTFDRVTLRPWPMAIASHICH